MAGILYCVGIGPGDPELITLKAARLLKTCPVIAIPNESKEKCTAYEIAVQAVPEIEKKESLCLFMPMTKDKDILERSHAEAAGKVSALLDQEKDVAMITLGDPTVYSTCLYIRERLLEWGYEAVLVNGIPSFCAAAARLGIPLVNGAQELHIIPASYRIEEALLLPGVKVLMKAGKKLGEVKRVLKNGGYQAMMVENCGMAGERVFSSLEEIPEDAGYYSLLIIFQNV